MRKKITEKHLKEIISDVTKKVLKETMEQPLKVEDYFDISKLSKSDIQSINVDMRIYLNRGFGRQSFFDGKDLIVTESVFRTVPVMELRKRLKNFGFKQWQLKSFAFANNVRIVILYVDIAKNTDVIINEMKMMGWDKVDISGPTNIKGVTFRILEFDPAVQKSLTKEVHKMAFVYHLTPIANEASILTNGIEARNENEFLEYPPRAHVIRGDVTTWDIARFGFELWHANTKVKDGRYSLLSIDTTLIPPDIEFYGDPRCQIGYITKQTIPPDGIRVVGHINYKDKAAYQGEQINFNF